MDLYSVGFNIKSIGCSFTSIVLACENGKLIAWGASPTHGELVSFGFSFIHESV